MRLFSFFSVLTSAATLTSSFIDQWVFLGASIKNHLWISIDILFWAPKAHGTFLNTTIIQEGTTLTVPSFRHDSKDMD